MARYDGGGAERASRAIESLYGDALLGDAGVVQVVAGWQSGEGPLLNIKIGPAAPESPTDRLALAIARARADAIVTTGRILREEPALRYAPETAIEHDLTLWRSLRLGREDPALVVVLSGSLDVAPDHPALAGPRGLVVTGPGASAERVEALCATGGIEVVERGAPGLLDTIDHLRGDRGARSILVEAGPSTARVLYEEAGRIDELMLSICHAEAISLAVRGAPLPTASMRRRAGLERRSSTRRREPSGSWSFERYCARSR